MPDPTGARSGLHFQDTKGSAGLAGRGDDGSSRTPRSPLATWGVHHELLPIVVRLPVALPPVGGPSALPEGEVLASRHEDRDV